MVVLFLEVLDDVFSLGGECPCYLGYLSERHVQKVDSLDEHGLPFHLTALVGLNLVFNPALQLLELLPILTHTVALHLGQPLGT